MVGCAVHEFDVGGGERSLYGQSLSLRVVVVARLLMKVFHHSKEEVCCSGCAEGCGFGFGDAVMLCGVVVGFRCHKVRASGSCEEADAAVGELRWQGRVLRL